MYGRYFEAEKKRSSTVHWSDGGGTNGSHQSTQLHKSASEQLRSYISCFGYTKGVKTELDSLDLQNDSLESRIEMSAICGAPRTGAKRFREPVYEIPNRLIIPQTVEQQPFINQSRYFQEQQSQPQPAPTTTENCTSHLWDSSDLPMSNFYPSTPAFDDDKSNHRDLISAESSTSSDGSQLPRATIDISRVSTPSSVELRDFENFLQTRLKEKKYPHTTEVKQQKCYPNVEFSRAASVVTPISSSDHSNCSSKHTLDPITLKLCKPLLEGTSTGSEYRPEYNRIMSGPAKAQLRAKLDSMTMLNDWKKVIPADDYHALLGRPLVTPARIESIVQHMRTVNPQYVVSPLPLIMPTETDTLRYTSTEKLDRLLRNTKHLVTYGRST